MPSTTRLFLTIGATAALLAVAFGAFGAHALRARLTPDLLAIYHTATQYHFYHALGLICIALLAAQFPAMTGLHMAGWLMTAGLILFSGSLYVLSLTGIRWLGAVTPLGGVAFITAWATVVLAVVRAR